MATWTRDAFSYAAGQMQHLTMVDPKWAQIEFDTIDEALNRGLLACLPQDQADLFTLDFWLDLENRAFNMLNASDAIVSEQGVFQNGRFATEYSPDRKPFRDTKQLEVTNITTYDEESDVSDAISDTSFTPPKDYLSRYARLDAEGRRHVVLPQGPAKRAPKQHRFIQEDSAGRQHLLPPPGFHGAAAKCMDEFDEWETVTSLSFERKRNVHEYTVPRGGVSLITVGLEPHKRVWGETPKTCRALILPERYRTKVPRRSFPKKKPLARGTTAAFWESSLEKGIFDTENDLLHNSRWPVSTF
ncbi:hypothetical protein F5Y09DRAFT_354482 [Xylaria sp. FL1042]|nr:hypothetical protein F5Y09DRAFT_354482 [Xylaria sp. FL1042]